MTQRGSRSEVARAFPQVPLVNGRRCVVLADGFYEWQRRQATSHRQPYFIYFPQVKPEKVQQRVLSGSRASWIFGWVSFLFFFFKFSAINYLFRFSFCPIISSFWDSHHACVRQCDVVP